MTAIATTHQESAPAHIPPTALSAETKSTLSDRFLLAGIQDLTLVIPAVWVVEIFRVERSQILALPFYSPLLIGITHHGGQVLPLLSTHSLLNTPSTALRENTMVVKLGDTAGAFAQVGLAIDRPLGSQTREALPNEIFSDPQSSSTSWVLLRPELVSQDLWQPLCWIPSSLST
jgi:chemotaxis signal transduction protein